MKDPSEEMQRAIHAKLIGNGPLGTAMGGTARVYDKVVGDPTYPFIRIGDDQAVGDSNGCADAWEIFVNVHIFSRHAIGPRVECKALSNLVVAALMNDGALPAPTGFQITEAELVQARTFPGPDGLTFQGVATIRYLVADAA
jgi:hypothetical protein